METNICTINFLCFSGQESETKPLYSYIYI